MLVLLTGNRAALASSQGGDVEQRELLLFEEPLVTAATKHLQSTRDAPSAVTVITREEIRRFGYRTLAEALRSVRGFYTTYDRNYTYLGARGFQRPSDYNDRVLVLVNGHTYNDDIFQNGFVGPEFGVDLEGVERIEVIRGPGGALYGGNALLAVINVVTTTGTDSPGVRPLVETGSFGRKRGQLSFGHTFGNGADVYATGSVLDVDGQEELFFPEFDSPETNRGVAEDADAERAYNLFLISRYRGFTLQGGANRRVKQIPTASFETLFNDSDTRTVDYRQFAELQHESQPLAGFETTIRAYYDGARYHGTYVIDSDGQRVKNEDVTSSDWLGGEARARREIFAGNALTVGAEYTYHPTVQLENFNLGGESFLDVRRSFGNWGVYAQDEWSPVESLTLTGGLRFDRYYDRIERVSPRVAAVWNPLNGSYVKLLYGNAFRAPNPFELYYSTSEVGGYLPNTGLRPETIDTYEAVIEQELPWRAEAVASVYHYATEELIDQETVETDDGTFLRFRNLGSARATGGELELRVPLPHDLSTRASYTVQDARARGGRRLSNSPRHLGSFGLLFPLPLDTEGGAELIVVAPRRTLAGAELDTVTLVNLTLVSRTPVPGLDFDAGLYNVLNQRYADPAGNEHQQDRIPQDRFTFRVALRYLF